MQTTTLTLHTRFRVGDVDPRLFGGFLEHMGRAVYQGVYDPASAHADADGLRRDVLDALGALAFTVVRYPGGNFASGYHWRDGVGPREVRPTVRELAWQSVEPNRFGTDEFAALCRRMGWQPMLTVNLGTGTPEEARDWVEYCNAPAGTRWADLRVAHGSPAPHGVGLWCLGNEMDGPWQLGHAPAGHYAIRAQQAAKMMKDVDRSLELVACGTSYVALPSYLEWDRVVLETLGDQIDYLSLHRYADNRADDTADFLALSNAIDRQIEEADALCRAVQGRRRSARRVRLAFDEWNVWYKDMRGDGAGKHAPALIEEVYNLEDALVTALFLNAFLRHADAVRIANLAQLVNVIAPVLTRGDELLRQSTWHALRLYAGRREGISLATALDGPGYEGRTHGRVGFVDAAAIWNGPRLHLFLVNRSQDRAAPLRVALADRPLEALESAECVTGPGPKAANSFERPDLVVARPFEELRLAGGAAELSLPPLSVVAATLRLG